MFFKTEANQDTRQQKNNLIEQLLVLSNYYEANDANDHSNFRALHALLEIPQAHRIIQSVTIDEPLYALINNVFWKVMNAVLSEKTQHITPAKKQELAHIEYLNLSLGNVLFKSSDSDLSAVVIFLEKTASLPTLLSAETYVAFLRWTVNATHPSFDSIWYCFRGLYTYSLALKNASDEHDGATDPLNRDVFEMLLSRLTSFFINSVVEEHVKKIHLILKSANKLIPTEHILNLIAPLSTYTLFFAKEWELPYYLDIQRKYLAYETRIRAISDGLDKNIRYQTIFNELQLLHAELKQPIVISALQGLVSYRANTHLDKGMKALFVFKMAPLDSLYQNMLRVFFCFYRKENNNIINIQKNMAVELARLLDTMMCLNLSLLNLNTLHTVALTLSPYIDAPAETIALDEFDYVYTVFKQLFQKHQEQMPRGKKNNPGFDLSVNDASQEALLYETMLVYTAHLYQRSNDFLYLSYGMTLIKNAPMVLDFELYNMYMRFVVDSDNPNFSFIWSCFQTLQKYKRNEAEIEMMFDLFKAALESWLMVNVDTSASDDLFSLNVEKHFSAHDLKAIIAQIEMGQNRALDQDVWFVFLQTMILHKNKLSDAQYKKIEGSAGCALHEFSFSPRSLNYLFRLMSYSPFPSIEVVRKIHALAKNKLGYLGVLEDDQLFKMLQKTPIVSSDDVEYFIVNCDLKKNAPSWLSFFNILLDKMILAPTPSQALDLIRCCNVHFQKEITNEFFFINDNKVCLNRMVKGLPAEMVSIFSLEAKIIHREYQANQELQQLNRAYRQEVMEKKVPLPKKMVTALLNVLVTIDSIDTDKHYLPSEKIALLSAIFSESDALHRWREQAKEINVKINVLCNHFMETLSTGLPDVLLLHTINQQCKNKIEDERVKQQVLKKNASSTCLIDAWETLRQGDLHEIQQVSKMLIPNLHNIEPYLIKIKCLVKLGCFDHALHWITKTRNQFPDKSRVFLLLQWASCCIGLGQVIEALAAYQQIYTLQTPPNRLTLTNIAYCHLLINKPQHLEKALDIYNHLLQDAAPDEHMTIMRCKIRCLLSQARLLDAEQQIKSLPNWKKNPDALAMFAGVLLQKNEIDSAILYYENALGYQKKLSWMKSLLLCYQKKHNMSKVCDIIRQIDRSTEDNYEGYALKASVYLQTEQYDKALVALNKITAKWGKSQKSYLGIAHCYRKLYRFDEAIEHLCAFPDYHHNGCVVEQLALTYCAAGQHAKALETYDYLLQEFSLNPYPYIKAIAYFIKMDDRARVKQYWDYCQSEFTEYQGLFAQTKQFIDIYHARDFHAVTNRINADHIDCMQLTTIDDEEMDDIHSLKDHYSTVIDSAEHQSLFERLMLPTAKHLHTRRYNPRYAADETDYNTDVLDLAYPSPPVFISSIALRRLGLNATANHHDRVDLGSSCKRPNI